MKVSVHNIHHKCFFSWYSGLVLSSFKEFIHQRFEDKYNVDRKEVPWSETMEKEEIRWNETIQTKKSSERKKKIEKKIRWKDNEKQINPMKRNNEKQSSETIMVNKLNPHVPPHRVNCKSMDIPGLHSLFYGIQVAQRMHTQLASSDVLTLSVKEEQARRRAREGRSLIPLRCLYSFCSLYIYFLSVSRL